MQHEKLSRLLAKVAIRTWVPSDTNSGRINTTDKMTIGFDVWVNHPDDERFKVNQRGGKQAIAIVERIAASRGIEVLSVVGMEVTEQREGTILNQPKASTSVGDDLEDFDLRDASALDLGLKLV